MTAMRIPALVVLALAASTAAWAHKPSDSYLRVTPHNERFEAEWDVALADLELLVGLDNDQDGRITWGELKSRRREIEAHALSRLALEADGERVSVRATDLLVNRHSDGAYAVLRLEADWPAASQRVELVYSLLFDVDPTHRGLVLLAGPSGATTRVLSPDSPRLSLTAPSRGLWSALGEYAAEGVWHIWIGFDHILFLLSLLLPAVLARDGGVWRGAASFGAAARGVLRIVTMFTLAHSITLWMAVTGLVELPSRLVESAIALSIVVTAAGNLAPSLRVSGGRTAFFFGLIHGFGFASVLTDLGLSQSSLAVALLGFNAGVEFGQVAIVLAFLPIAYLLRGTAFYRRVILQGGSVLVGLVALVWLYERAMNAEVLGF